MKNIKKLIYLAIILLIVLIIILLILMSSIKKVEYIDYDEGGEPTIEELSEKNNVAKVTNPTEYYTVVKCINKYLKYCSTAIPTGLSVEDRKEASMTEEEKLTRIYNELSMEYIKENNITINNVRKYVHTTENYLTLYPINMNMLISKSNQMISSYGVYGRLKDSGTGKFIGYGYIIVIIDSNNKTFSIKPCINTNINSIDDLDLVTEITEIEKNKNNEFTFVATTEEFLIKNYFNNFKMYVKSHSEIAYEYLDSEYKEKKFGSLAGFEDYIKNNNSIGNIVSYQSKQFDNYTQYICIDSNGNYYIFRDTAVMEYKVMLDTYTIDLPEFLEKYNKEDNATKIGMNIQKIFDAINDGDYNYAYKKLDNTFKQNNFPNIEVFENYAKQYFSNNQIEYNKCEENGDIYMYNIKIKENVEKTIIMKLLEGTDFVYSFNVE